MSRFRSITVWLEMAALAAVLVVAVPCLAGQNRRNEVPRPPAQSHREQSGHAGQWLRQHRNLPPEQQKRALQNDPQFRSLPPQRQQRYLNQLDRFNRMPPEQQQRVLNRMETWEHLTPQQKDQARQLHSQMQELSPDRREAVRNAVQALRAMPPEARQRQIESDRYKNMFSPHEREMLNNASRLPLAPAEAGPEQ